MSLLSRLQADVLAERKKRADGDREKVDSLGFVVAQVKQKCIDENRDRDQVDDAIVVQVIRKQIKQQEGTRAVLLEQNGDHTEAIAKIERELTCLASYLPQPPSEEALQSAIAAVIQTLTEPSTKSMGQVMAAIKQQFDPSSLDMAVVSRLIKQELA